MISKRDLMSAHRWTGIIAGLFLAVQGLTGLTIAFRDELMEAMAPTPLATDMTTSPASLDTLVSIVQRAHPRSRITRITPPRAVKQPIVIRVSDQEERLLFFAPSSGRLLKDAPARAYVPELLYDLHTHFLLGENGKWIIALDGLALLFMAISGVWFWWPGRNRIKQSLKIPWTAALPRVVGSLHRICGVILCLFLAGIALTGITLALYDEVSANLAQILPVTTAPPYPSVPYSGPLLSLEAVRSEIASVAPGQRIKNLRFKTRDMRVARAILAANGPKDWHFNQIWIDRADGRILSTQIGAQAPTGSKLLSWLLPLHSGQALGLAGRLFNAFLAIALVLFAGSGLWLWSTRQFRKATQRS